MASVCRPPPASASPSSFFHDDLDAEICGSFLGYVPVAINSSDRCVFQGFGSAQPAPAAPAAATDSMENSDTSSSFSSSFMSSNSDDDEDDADSGTSSASSSLSQTAEDGPLHSLDSLCAALPIKRGLSRYFNGKSQSFSALAHVSSVADLAKPENPYAKRRKMQQRISGGGKNHSYPPRYASSAAIAKRHTNSRFTRSPPKSPHAKGNISKQWPVSKCLSVPELQDSDWTSFSPKP